MQKRLMIVGSGQWQISIIRRAKSMGYYVINSNLYSDSIGFKFADIGIKSDIYDLEDGLRIAREHKINGIISNQIDIAVPTVAYIAEKMDLPGIGVKTAELFTNKLKMREFCQKNGFDIPHFSLCITLQDAHVAAGEIGYPVVIKPINNRSSRGVHKIGNQSQLIEKFPDTMANCKDDQFLIEEYIGGVEHTVEGFKAIGGHTTLGISRKSHYDSNQVLSHRLFYSNDGQNSGYSELKKINDRLIEATGLRFGITHSEYKSFNGKFYLMEFAARGGGANISSHIVPQISGVNIEDLLIRSAMGETVPQISVPHQRCAALLQFFLLAPGKVRSVSGLQSICAHPNVLDAGIIFKTGDTLISPPNGSFRAGHFIAFEKTDEALERLSKDLSKLLKVEYEQAGSYEHSNF